jgi:hypothetical protein
MNGQRTFSCSICGDPSTQICVWCTKDACANHICAKCLRCSDCCECEVPLDEPEATPPGSGTPAQ